MFDLRVSTSPRWVETVLSDMNSFLIDHASCERKASATAISFVVRYPNRKELVETMIEVAQDELEHFKLVTEKIHRRGLQLGSDQKDPYINGILKHSRTSSMGRLVDRLLIFGIVEGRGCERFKMLAEALPDPELAEFYHNLFKSEARHHAAFIRIAKKFAPEKELRERLDELLDAEAKIVEKLDFRAALH